MENCVRHQCGYKFWCSMSGKCWNNISGPERLAYNNTDEFRQKHLEYIKNPNMTIERSCYQPPIKIRGVVITQSIVGVRKRIYDRDKQCLACGSTDSAKFTLDHIVPKSKGGKNDYDNYQTLCKKCNFEKADRIRDYRNIVK